MKITIKCCHFASTEVIDAERQVLLNILTEQELKDTFKN
jgi:hypothetical protein